MADVVLVHGAYHGGWCWRDVAAPLREAGHRVFTPSLTGLGDRNHLLAADTDVDVHVRDLAAVMDCEELERAVLVAHSYGGMPVTMLADRMPERIAALFYLDAFVPVDGESHLGSRSARPGARPIALPDGAIASPPPDAALFGLEGELAAWVNRRMTTHPVAAMRQVVHLGDAFKRVPSRTYVRCRRYANPAFDQALERARADGDWRIVEGDWPHNRMMIDPGWFLGLLAPSLRAAAR